MSSSFFKGFIPFLSAVVVLTSCFTNCSVSFNAAPRATSLDSMGNRAEGNGTGYGGMVYVRSLAGGACSDGSPIDAQIFLIDNFHGILARENCADIPDREIQIESVNSTEGTLLANGLTYVLATSPPSGSGPGSGDASGGGGDSGSGSPAPLTYHWETVSYTSIACQYMSEPPLGEQKSGVCYNAGEENIYEWGTGIQGGCNAPTFLRARGVQKCVPNTL